MTIETPVCLTKVEPADLPDFKRALQAAFALAVVDEYGPLAEPIPSDRDLDAAISTSGAQTLHVMLDGQRVGGAVVVIDEATQQNRLDLFYVATGAHGRGIGRRAWAAIEALFPETRVWETTTPYFEKRNIHFYVNVCGFHIVEFFNERNRGPHQRSSDDPLGEEMFRFEKSKRTVGQRS